MINMNGAISLSKPPGLQRTIRIKGTIAKIKQRLNRKRKVSSRKLAAELSISRTSVRRILKKHLECWAYKVVKELAITDTQKVARKKFAVWIHEISEKMQQEKFLFSDEKYFDLNGVYNSKNERIWAINCAAADDKGGVKQKHQYPVKVMVWLGACSKGLTSLVIFEKGTLDHVGYIDKLLPVVKKCGNKMLGEEWWFQQDNAPSHKD
ncbi:unnamed protein product [Didymodactylos carnosus]|uniref:Transposase n=1 Tax=Didymodactylos carnosus TaxID=1234261 RepID=A0A8S2TXI0_9BILA|nr:unnamed protein product [Didymodactylos carnosus]